MCVFLSVDVFAFVAVAACAAADAVCARVKARAALRRTPFSARAEDAPSLSGHVDDSEPAARGGEVDARAAQLKVQGNRRADARRGPSRAPRARSPRCARMRDGLCPAPASARCALHAVQRVRDGMRTHADGWTVNTRGFFFFFYPTGRRDRHRLRALTTPCDRGAGVRGGCATGAVCRGRRLSRLQMSHVGVVRRRARGPGGRGGGR